MTTPTWQEIKNAAMSQLLEILQTGQSVSSDGRTLTHADIGRIESLIEKADAHIAKANRAGLARMIGVVPRT